MNHRNFVYDVVCGMPITDIYKSEVSRFEGKKYYFCCMKCKMEFDDDPVKYLKDFEAENELMALYKKDKWERDPVCGDMIKIKEAKAMSLYKDIRYYFCCPICKKLFDKNPSAYADKLEGFYNPVNPKDS